MCACPVGLCRLSVTIYLRSLPRRQRLHFDPAQPGRRPADVRTSFGTLEPRPERRESDPERDFDARRHVRSLLSIPPKARYTIERPPLPPLAPTTLCLLTRPTAQTPSNRTESGERCEHRLLQALQGQSSGSCRPLMPFVPLPPFLLCPYKAGLELTDPSQEYERIVRESIKEQLGL